jgi:hypothetical protein
MLVVDKWLLFILYSLFKGKKHNVQRAIIACQDGERWGAFIFSLKGRIEKGIYAAFKLQTASIKTQTPSKHVDMIIIQKQG